MDIVVGNDGDLYVLNRTDGEGGQIRLTNWDDEDLGDIGSGFIWPVQMIAGPDDSLVVSDEGNHTIGFWAKDGAKINSWGEHGSGDGELNRPSGIVFDADGNLRAQISITEDGNGRMILLDSNGAIRSAIGPTPDGPSPHRCRSKLP